LYFYVYSMSRKIRYNILFIEKKKHDNPIYDKTSIFSLKNITYFILGQLLEIYAIKFLIFLDIEL
jgi:hypothetical protein